MDYTLVSVFSIHCCFLDDNILVRRVTEEVHIQHVLSLLPCFSVQINISEWNFVKAEIERRINYNALKRRLRVVQDQQTAECWKRRAFACRFLNGFSETYSNNELETWSAV